MAKFSYLWLVETPLGTWKDWLSRGRKGPKVESDGSITLDKRKYSVDAKKFRKWHVRNRRGDIKHTLFVQLWRQDEPTPTDFLAPEKQVGDDITATVLQRLSRIKRLDLIQNENQLDWQTMLLIASVIGNLIAIGFLVYMLV